MLVGLVNYMSEQGPLVLCDFYSDIIQLSMVAEQYIPEVCRNDWMY